MSADGRRQVSDAADQGGEAQQQAVYPELHGQLPRQRAPHYAGTLHTLEIYNTSIDISGIHFVSPQINQFSGTSDGSI